MPKLTVFRKFRDDQFKPFGLPNGEADEAFIALAAKNTNTLVEKGIYVPPLQETHDGAIDGAASGWFDKGIALDGEALLGEPDLTPRGKQRIGSKEFRYLSSSFRKDFEMPDGTILKGPYLHHVALVNNPRIKGLSDLAKVQFSEDAAPIRVGSDETTGEVVFLAEFSADEENTMTAEEIAALQDKAKKADELAAQFAEEKQKRETVEAQLAESKKKEARAEFAEIVRKVKADVRASREKKLFGASTEKALVSLGVTLAAGNEAIANFSEVMTEEKVVANTDAGALFAEVLQNIPQAAPGTRIADDAEFSDDSVKPRKADFAEAATNPEAANRIAAYVAKQKKSKPAYTPFDAQREICG